MNSLPPLWAVIVALVVAVLGTAGITSLLTVRAVNRKTLASAKLDEESAEKAEAEARKIEAEARKAAAEASEFLIGPLTRRAKQLEENLAAAIAETADLRRQLGEMSKELTQLRDENQRLRSGSEA